MKLEHKMIVQSGGKFKETNILNIINVYIMVAN